MKASILVLLFYWVMSPDLVNNVSNTENKLEESYIKFNIRNLGLNVEGTFKSFKTTVEYNKSQPEKSSFSAEIHVDKYPTIKFQSTKVTAVSESGLKVLGDLTIKGKTLPITLEVALSPAGSATQFAIKGELDRRDYEVGGSSWVMSDEVYLDLLIVK